MMEIVNYATLKFQEDRMPTYACSTAAGRLTPAQKTDIVRCISTVHHEETGAPRYLVQVISYEVASGNHYIAGELARPDQIWIRGDLRSGRTEERKGKILRRILQGVAKSTAAAEEAVWVYLSDIPATNIAEYGRILPLPGNEDAWFVALPDPLKARLGPLA